MSHDDNKKQQAMHTKRLKKTATVTQTMISDEDDVEPPVFSLAVLGLQPVGTVAPPRQPHPPIQMFNTRGMPFLTRKKNRFFFCDNIINDEKPLRNRSFKVSKTPKLSRTPKLSSIPTKPSADVQRIPVNKKLGRRIGQRLHNLLKLPKAHKWVIFEWFYSLVDQPLFYGENDFQNCLAESFPKLRTRHLGRAEWRRIRSLMGKPRRCSHAFFEEERRDLERKRQKIRYMQTRKSNEIKDLNYVRDLPDEIPLPLPVGTKVSARLRVPQDGIFSGTVDAFDSMTSTYRVTFDRADLGTHSIPDLEIASENFHMMLPLQRISKDLRPNLMNVFKSGGGVRGGVRSGVNMNLNKSDSLLGEEVFESTFKTAVIDRETINGYPAKMLETLVRLKSVLAIKRSKLERLSDMNIEAEIKASQEPISTHNVTKSSGDELQAMETALQHSEEFQRRYASIILSMEKMNRDMQDYLNNIQEFGTELTHESQMQAMLASSTLREKCREAAEYAVEQNNQEMLQNENVLTLIKNLATVLMVASHLGKDENSEQTTEILEGCIEEVASDLFGVNMQTFQKNVLIHLQHFRPDIGQSMFPPTVSNAPH